MRKRIKLSIPKLIKEILDQDTFYFEIKLERLCNIIVQEMGYEPTLRIQDKLKNERKIPITFNLNERNSSYIQNMILNSSENIETEFFRSLLSTYANLHPSLRERVVKKSIYTDIELAIKEKLNLKISYQDKIIDIIPLIFQRDDESNYNQLQGIINSERIIFRLKDIDILKIGN
ncbi:MAG: hypothetical protein ACRDDH_20155 [Cetobacterium sp.]|uniref:hypothetical protein n=1 Tax=Cetobacterium sp. TaxID=2071632 RepID=UPI003EE65BF1